LGDWAEKLGSLLPLRSRPARSASRDLPGPAQGELCLSLDRVKVVRNDLSDSDVEIVPARRAAATKAKGEALAANPSEEIAGKAVEPAGGNFRMATAWGQATTRLFGSAFVRSAPEKAGKT
jgi:hypothetical protein